MQLFVIWTLVIWIFKPFPQIFANEQITNKLASYQDGNLPALHRSHRDAPANKLSEIIENMQSLARLTNGISLEIGLIDGSIPSDDAIAELLHMGPVKLQELISMDTDAASKAITDLGTLSETLQSSPAEVTTLENRLVILEDIRKTTSILNMFQEELPGRKEYEAELKRLPELNNTSIIISEMIKNVKAVEVECTRFDDFQKGDTIDSITANFPRLYRDFNKTENYAISFENVLSSLKLLDSIKNMSLFLEPVYQESAFRKELNLSTLTSVIYQALNQFSEQLQTIRKYVSNTKASESDLKYIQRLINSLNSKNVVTFSAGFPKGPKDLEILSQSIDNKWIVEHGINSSIVGNHLSKAFGVLDELQRKLTSAEGAWTSTSSSNEKSIASILFLQADTASLPEETDVSGTIDLLKNCDIDRRSASIHVEQFSSTTAAIKNLNEDISKVLTYDLRLFDYVEKLKDLSSLKNIVETTTDDVQGKAAIEKMKANPKFEEVKTILVTFQQDLGSLRQLIDGIHSLAGKINFSLIDEYYKEINEPLYEKFYVCLGNITNKWPIVQKAVSVVHQVRNLTQQTVSSAGKIVEAVSNSNLKSLQVSGNRMRNVTIREALALKSSFPNSQKNALNLGMAVQGLAQIKSLLENRKKLEEIGNQVDAISEDAKGVMSLTVEHRESLNSLKNLSKSIKSLFKEVEQFIGSVNGLKETRRERNAVNFASTGQICVEAAKLVGIPSVGDVSALKAAVVAVNPTKFSKVIDALDVLAKMDLNFKKYNFQSAPASLQALDLFFVNYPLHARPPPTPITPSGSASAPGSGSATNGTNSASNDGPESSSMMWYIISGVAVALVLVAAGVIVYIMMRKKPEPQNVEKPIPKPNPPPAPAKPDPVPVVVAIDPVVPAPPEVVPEEVKELVVEDTQSSLMSDTQYSCREDLVASLADHSVKAIQNQMDENFKLPNEWAKLFNRCFVTLAELNVTDSDGNSSERI